jgi:DeoR family transcriptional regulator, fructose operon transcriptional repressor
VLADSSKFGIETAIRFASPAEVDVLVTDDEVSSADRRALGRAGIEIVVA